MRTRMHGAPRRWGASLLGLAVIVTVCMIATSVPAAMAVTTDTTTTLPLPAAPAGFSDQLVTVYQSEYSTGAQLGQTSALTSLSQYQSQVSQLTPDQLNSLYYATQQVPPWSQIPSLMQAIQSDLPSGGTFKTGITPLSSSTKASTKKSKLAGVNALSTADDAPTAFTPQDCSFNNIPDAAVFAAQIVIDAGLLVYNIGAAFSFVGPEAAIVGAAVLFAGQVVHDTLVYLQTLNLDCKNSNVDGYLEHIDGTTVQTYNLLSTLTGGITDVQTTLNTTQQTIQDTNTQLTSFQTTIQKNLNNDVQTLQSATGNDVQTVQNLMQTVQIALQQDTQTLQAASAANAQLVIKEVDKGTASVQTALTNNLTQALHEIDVDAQTLTTMVTQNNQQLTNMVNSQFATGQGEYQSNLKQLIETVLASGAAVVQLKLPASMGGYLDSTPVGVQEVVNDDLHAFQALNVAIQPGTVSLVNAGNAALAAGQYLVAFGDFQKAYQAYEVGA